MDRGNRAISHGYLKIHSTYVPIGTNFQTDIPDIMGARSYLYRKQDAIDRIKSLKVHDPALNKSFYSKWRKFI